MTIQIRRILVFAGIVTYGMIFLVPFLGHVHLFNVDELNFAEPTREMLLSGDYLNVQINFKPFWEKPPLFFWLQAISMKVFGVTDFAARFPNAICGMLILFVLYNAGSKLYDEKFGLYWMFAYAGSILPFFYLKTGIIDPWFNLFIFLGIIYFIYYLTENEKRKRHLIISAFVLGLAILTKGPVALLVFLLTFFIFLIFRRFRINTNLSDVLVFSGVLILTGGSWYILQIMDGNAKLIWEFIEYQFRLFLAIDTVHTGFFMFHFVIILIGVFPASLIALLSFKDHFDGPGLRKDFFLWMMILFWIVILLFSIVNKKIIHYSSLSYLPLTFLAALTLRKYENSEIRIPQWLKYLIGIFASVFGIVLSVIPVLDRYKYKYIEIIQDSDPFTAANLKADVKWSGYEPVVGLGYILSVLLVLYFLNRKRKWTLRLLFLSTSVYVYLTMILVTPRVEAYMQMAAVDFYKSISSEDAYIATLGFKSYAHLYYGRVQPENGLIAADPQWMLEGDIDREAYFVFKISRKEEYLKKYPQLILIDEKNGYVFARRLRSQ